MYSKSNKGYNALAALYVTYSANSLSKILHIAVP